MFSEVSMQSYTAQFTALYISFKNNNQIIKSIKYQSVLYIGAKKKIFQLEILDI